MIALAACDAALPDDGLVIEGGGEDLSAEFPLPAGFYLIRWAADGGDTGRRCLVSIAIEPSDPDAARVNGARTTAVRRKIVYRTVAAGERAGGDVDQIFLPAGLYRLRSDGGCGWQARFLPGRPGTTPAPGQNTLEQADRDDPATP